jgi:hypothetical protein
VWNPDNRKWDEILPAERPLVTVRQPPFRGGKWTHVVFTFENFNTGRADGMARLYLDGEFAGSLPPRRQTFTWNEQQAAVMLGLGYLGLMDELSIFDRALTEHEVRCLYKLPGGITSLVRP